MKLKYFEIMKVHVHFDLFANPISLIYVKGSQHSMAKKNASIVQFRIHFNVLNGLLYFESLKSQEASNLT